MEQKVERFDPSKEKVLSILKILERDEFTYDEWQTLEGIVEEQFRCQFNDFKKACILKLKNKGSLRFGGRYMRGDLPTLKKEK